MFLKDLLPYWIYLDTSSIDFSGILMSLTACLCVLSYFSHVWFFVTLWTCQAPLSMGFSREEHWNGFPCPPPGNLPASGIETTFLNSPAFARGSFTTRATWEARYRLVLLHYYYFLPPCLLVLNLFLCSYIRWIYANVCYILVLILLTLYVVLLCLLL